jgi:hypothetical protein
VQANFAATGKWFLLGNATPPAAVDWDALAAQVRANFATTGQWFVSPAPTQPYMLFSRASAPPGTRELWQPLGAVGGAAGSTPGLVDGLPAVVQLSAFDAFHGTDSVQPDWAIFGLVAQHTNAPTPGSLFVQQMGSFSGQGATATGNVLAGSAAPPNFEFTHIGTASDHIGRFAGLAPVGSPYHITNFEMLTPTAVIDQLLISGFEDVRVKLVEGEFRGSAVALSIADAVRGEVDAGAEDGPHARLGLTLSLGVSHGIGDATFTVFGTNNADDSITITGGDGKVVLHLGSGHDVVDAAASGAALEVLGGPDPAGTSISPGFSVALGEGAGPGVLTLGGPVVQANLFYAGLQPGDAVPVTLTRVNGEQVQAVGHAELALAPGETVARLALHVVAPVSFVSAQLDLAVPPVSVVGNGLELTAVPFAVPRAFAPDGHGDGTVITLGGGADVLHVAAGREGGLMVRGFDVAQDHLVLDGADPATVRIYEVAENSATPAARVSTLVAFADVAPGAVLHELVYLPAVQGLSLGSDILIC